MKKSFRRVLGSIVGSATLAAVGALTSTLFVSSPVHAEAYSWQDVSGTTFFGSTPPAGASNVKKLQGRSFSRYSSEKVIRGYNKSAENATRQSRGRIKESDLPTNPGLDGTGQLDSQERPGTRARLVDAPEIASQTNTEPSSGLTTNGAAPSAGGTGGGSAGGTATLEQGKITVTHDANQWVSACKVIIKNPGNVAAQKVLVSFEFEDGTIVPAKGPEVIAGKGEAVYFIAPESLPVKVHYQRPAKTVTGISYQKLPRPKVIIQSTPVV